MAKYVEFPLPDGGAIVIEAADDKRATAGSGFVKSGAEARDAADKASQAFDASLDSVRQSANVLLEKLNGLSQKPDELEVTFGLKVSGELGQLVVAKGGADANYHVVLRWRQPRPEKAEGEAKTEQA